MEKALHIAGPPEKLAPLAEGSRSHMKELARIHRAILGILPCARMTITNKVLFLTQSANQPNKEPKKDGKQAQQPW